MNTISVVIITKNEASNIRACLESVKWADEIVVLDSGSSDDTVAICREYTDKVYNTDWPGFGPQKNRAMQHATKDWILSIDADERVTPELQQEILQLLQQRDTDVVAYKILRRNYYCGKALKFLRGWAYDRVIRLVKKDTARFSDDLVHESIVTSGPVSLLKHALLHYSYANLEQVLEKINSYSTYGAQKYLEQGKKAGIFKAIFAGLWAFLRTYFLHLGFLEGGVGFVIAVTSAESSYYKYLKLFYLRRESSTHHISD